MNLKVRYRQSQSPEGIISNENLTSRELYDLLVKKYQSENDKTEKSVSLFPSDESSEGKSTSESEIQDLLSEIGIHVENQMERFSFDKLVALKSSIPIISSNRNSIYSCQNSQAKLPLLEWYSKMTAAKSKNYIELKKIFNSVDTAKDYTIFDIGGNNYRLISAIHYNLQICYIRKIMTHSEYSKKQNQLKLSRGEL